jgi:hypothetical protein
LLTVSAGELEHLETALLQLLLARLQLARAVLELLLKLLLCLDLLILLLMTKAKK